MNIFSPTQSKVFELETRLEHAKRLLKNPAEAIIVNDKYKEMFKKEIEYLEKEIARIKELKRHNDSIN